MKNPEWFNDTISAYNAYKNGFLPHAGGIADQHALFMTIMSALDDALARCEDAKSTKGRRPSGDSTVSVLGKRNGN